MSSSRLYSSSLSVSLSAAHVSIQSRRYRQPQSTPCLKLTRPAQRKESLGIGMERHRGHAMDGRWPPLKAMRAQGAARRWVIEQTFCLDRKTRPHRLRLRAPARSHGPAGRDSPHGTTPRHHAPACRITPWDVDQESDDQQDGFPGTIMVSAWSRGCKPEVTGLTARPWVRTCGTPSFLRLGRSPARRSGWGVSPAEARLLPVGSVRRPGPT